MAIVISALTSLVSKMLTAKIVEGVIITLVRELVKRSSSKVDDQLLEIIEKGMK